MGVLWICARRRVDVVAAVEGFDERGLWRGGREAEFDLRVVGGDEDAVWRCDEGFADVSADVCADGDVLEVWVADESLPVAATVG